MYMQNTAYVYSYFEARIGAKYNETVFFGLQGLLQEYLSTPVTQADIEEAAAIFEQHFGDSTVFNREGWEYIVNTHNGRLPVDIRAVLEGTVVPISNVLMTIVNTDPNCFWLTNWLETLLCHLWYPITVATLSYNTKKMINSYLDATSDNPSAIDFMLHDFGYRGASSEESAGIGGAAHLINFMGTDTLAAMKYAHDHYSADYNSLAFSVRASEHSVMTSDGVNGEMGILDRILDTTPNGIVSIVADSYNIYDFVHNVCLRKDRIMARDGRTVIRPDSITEDHKSPEELTEWIVAKLYDTFGGTVNSKGFKVLDDHVRVLWGDGINPDGINAILWTLKGAGFSAENMVFGMGGGLLQRDINRDTQRFAFKCSAQYRNGEWIDVQKSPLDASKASKPGRLKLIETLDGFKTVRLEEPGIDKLQLVYRHGEIMFPTTFDEIRSRAVQ